MERCLAEGPVAAGGRLAVGEAAVPPQRDGAADRVGCLPGPVVALDVREDIDVGIAVVVGLRAEGRKRAVDGDAGHGGAALERGDDIEGDAPGGSDVGVEEALGVGVHRMGILSGGGSALEWMRARASRGPALRQAQGERVVEVG